MKTFTRLFMVCLGMLSLSNADAAITKQCGWLESAAIEWAPVDGVKDYHVYVKPTGGSYEQIDQELVRQYPGYFRADALGLKAGTYQMKVVPVDAQDQEVATSAMESDNITVTAHNRSGLAHITRIATGHNNLGAYNNDGTLLSNAKVIYVWADNAKTVSTSVVSSSNGATTTYTGLQQIIYGYQKGYDTTPLDIRIIGTIKAEDMDKFGSTAEGLQVKGSKGYSDMHMTIEGVGEDATVSGFGFLIRNTSNFEMRNFAIMLCMDDAVSLDTNNSECWIHNMDLFYGNTGGDADQAKGDGTVDIKGKSMNITVSFNHFWDTGKSSLGGMKSEGTNCWMSYHHNWFDHSDSRHPRIRTAFYHVYNNYFDGVAKYGVGATCGGSSFIENNVFRNCKYPMLISKQGTDAEGNGTFSGEAGGVIKAYNNTILNARKLQYYDGKQTDGKWDAVLAASRGEEVTATCLSGGTGYNNDADAAARASVPADELEDVATVKETVKKYAGRMNGGDFVWKFLNSAQDENYSVIKDLKQALIDYKSTLVSFSDGEAISNGGSTTTTAVKGGDGQNISDEDNEKYVPTYGGGGSGTITPTINGKYILGSTSDYYWFNAANDATTQEYLSEEGKDGIVFTASEGSQYNTTREVKGSDGTMYSDYIGAIRLASNGTLDVNYNEGIASVAFYLSASGTQNWTIQASKDGADWTAVSTVTISGKKGEHPSAIIYGTTDKETKYVRLTNTNGSTRDVQGVKLAAFSEDGGDGDSDGDEDVKSSDSSADFDIYGEDIAFSSNKYTLELKADDTTENFIVRIYPADNAAIDYVENATAIEGEDAMYSIAAPVAGQTVTAKFRIIAENKANTTTYFINIVKAAQGGSEDKGEDKGDTPAATEEIVTFTKGSDGKTPVPSNSNLFNVVSATVKVKQEVKYEGLTLDVGVKFETATEVNVTPTKDCTIVLVFDTPNKKINVDGEKQTTDANGYLTLSGKAGQKIVLKKGDSMNLYAVHFNYSSSTGINGVKAEGASDKGTYKYAENGAVYITDGSKTATLAGARVK